MSHTRRPTLLAVIAQPGEEAFAPGGTLASSGWRGVRTALATLHDGETSALREAAARAATLLGVESHFQGSGEGEAGATRLARIMRALHPSIIVTNAAAATVTEEAWTLAAASAVRMPGLPLLDPSKARLWRATERDKRVDAQVDISVARPLLRALRFYYPPTTYSGIAAEDGSIRDAFEYFALLDGFPLPASAHPVADLFAGLSLSPPKPPFSFLAEEQKK